MFVIDLQGKQAVSDRSFVLYGLFQRLSGLHSGIIEGPEGVDIFLQNGFLVFQLTDIVFQLLQLVVSAAENLFQIGLGRVEVDSRFGQVHLRQGIALSSHVVFISLQLEVRVVLQQFQMLLFVLLQDV